MQAVGGWAVAKGVLVSYGIRVEPVTCDDAEWAATRWRRGVGLSLADRLCLALAARLGSPVVAADRSWGTTDRVIQIR